VTGGLKVPVVRLARMGGQYAKPRSKQTEVVDGKEINSFRCVDSSITTLLRLCAEVY